MSEMNLKQITDKLNSEFAGDARKLVFWYDGNAEFAEDVDSLELDNAKVLHIEEHNQFQTKLFLECTDTTTNYLVYAPFPKPALIDNHLADTLRYSAEFSADRASLLILNLGINEKFKPLIQKYIKFFADKERTQKFADLELENPNQSAIEIGLMSIICKCKVASFEETMRSILNGSFDDNSYIAEFEKYDLLDGFWQQVNDTFGYTDPKPTLEKLVISLFVTYFSKVISGDVPKEWLPLISCKSGSIMAFMDNLMNNSTHCSRYDEIAEVVYSTINGRQHLADMKIDALVDCNIFAGVDELIIQWLLTRLEGEDIGTRLNGRTIPEICADRRKKHYGTRFKNEYCVIENAFHIVSDASYQQISGIKNIIELYTASAYKIDSCYRNFYFYLDQMEDTTAFEKLRDLIENIYTNEFLNKLTSNWSTEFTDAKGETGLVLQRNFFSKYLNSSKKRPTERTVVIISDALRYEVAHTLFEQLQADEKCTATISAMQGVLPSYTPLGMAALLPHEKIEYNQNYDVIIDGRVCDTTELRETHLKRYKENSRCVQFDSLKNAKQADLRAVFTGQEVVYIYHNQIDARGDSAKTENEVFAACAEAIKEIHDFIKRLSSCANTHHFLITADHGFIYKRNKIQATDKIDGVSAKSNSIGQRYSIAQEGLNADGACSISLGTVLGNDDSRVVSYPLASDIFKVAGAGQNFVHGGCSPQEMLVPLIDVKVESGKKETSAAQLTPVNLTNKITNLITSVDFVQTEPVSDIVKETTYRIYFISDTNEKISNEHICIADKKEPETIKRIFRLRFNFKNKQYNNSHKYYLIVFDDKREMEVLKHEVVMDIAFANDFNF